VEPWTGERSLPTLKREEPGQNRRAGGELRGHIFEQRETRSAGEERRRRGGKHSVREEACRFCVQSTSLRPLPAGLDNLAPNQVPPWERNTTPTYTPCAQPNGEAPSLKHSGYNHTNTTRVHALPTVREAHRDGGQPPAIHAGKDFPARGLSTSRRETAERGRVVVCGEETYDVPPHWTHRPAWAVFCPHVVGNPRDPAVSDDGW